MYVQYRNGTHESEWVTFQKMSTVEEQRGNQRQGEHFRMGELAVSCYELGK